MIIANRSKTYTNYKAMRGILLLLVLLFASEVKSQVIFSDGGKYGLMDLENKVIFPANYDKITPYADRHQGLGSELFILQKGPDYFFAVKQFWETSVSTTSWIDNKIDSIKWFFNEQAYDSLYVLGECLRDQVFLSHTPAKFYDKKKKIWKENHLSQAKYHYLLGYKKAGMYGRITYELNSKEVEKKHEPRGGGGGDWDYSKRLSSLTNIQVHPTKYTGAFITATHTNPVTTLHDGKYGILNISYNYEVAPQFDSIPIRFEELFYCVKKNGMWGLIFLQEHDSILLEIIPCRYSTIKQLQLDCRGLEFYQDGSRAYPACLYAATENTPLKLLFVINRFYLGGHFPIDQKPPIKTIHFIPTLDGKEIIQEHDDEYLIVTDRFYMDNNTEKAPTFFIIKIQRNPNPFPKAWNSYSSYSSHGIKYRGGRPIKSILTYQFEKDTFSHLHTFPEESENTQYEIVNTYWWGSIVLKQTHVPNDLYKHEFYSTTGEKIHEVSSKYPIDEWEENYYDPIIEFFAEVPPKKGSKKTDPIRKVICRYNLAEKKFRK